MCGYVDAEQWQTEIIYNNGRRFDEWIIEVSCKQRVTALYVIGTYYEVIVVGICDQRQRREMQQYNNKKKIQTIKHLK